MKKIYCDPSPCIVCNRVKDPENCENKQCRVWRDWFCTRWELIHRFPRVMMENAELTPVGVSVGGRVYPAPHQVEEYRKKNPCDSCLCPKDLCKSPCALRRQWLKGGK
jgi:hypothetical protein